MFKRLFWYFLKNPFSLSPFQWWEYFLSSSYYFAGAAFFTLMICPIAYILFKVPSFFAMPGIYFLTFIPYIVLSLSVFYMALGLRNYRSNSLFSGQLLAAVTFPVYMRAAFFALIGKRVVFEVTSKDGRHTPSPGWLLPQIAMLLLNFIAVVWAVNRLVYEHEPALLVNGFWALYHFLLLSSIFYFSEEEPGRIRGKRLYPGTDFSYNIINAQNLPVTDKAAWRICVTVFLPERIDAGTQLMCKIKEKGGSSFVFEGVVVWSGRSAWRKGFETTVGVLTASESARRQLKEVMK
ncbi:MAG: hypothetical protein PHO34_00270 [Candidatus Omnitrophica bacterium]|nr:hypothetical protein [Candidatus Omnitrophota bacterium]MDD5500669.1 hypothetical protein [Candidatus Omnitrophota bacterium]